MLRYLVYKILKKYAGICVYFFYKKWQIDFREPVPEGPVLFVANHQNSFLDAIVLACSTKRDPWFLTRAGVFEKPFIKKILGLLRMSPVYRFRDGFSTLRKNDEMISNCVNLLEEGHAILIFGEGNHNDKFYLRPLQKGFARIAAAAEEKNHSKLKVKIVPVGLQYDSHTEFRSRVLVTFGKAITVHEIWDEAKNYQENLDAILSKTAQELKPLMLHIDPNHYDQNYAYFNDNRIIKNDLILQLKADQELIAHVPDSYSVTQKTDTTDSVNINPIYWYERLNNLIPRSIIHWVLKKKVKDPQFIGSLKYAIGMFIVPISYALQTALCYGITGSSLISGIYFCSLPLMVWLKR